MKKIIFLLTIFLLGFNANALTNNGKLYEIYWQESKIGVFASDETYHSMDYNGIMVKSTTDNNIYYCIEPESYMTNHSEASSNSHIIYDGEGNIISNSRLTKETYEEISLLAYYGYGYKDNMIDHSDVKWYGITQVMMWRILRPDINYVFKESRYGIINNSLYLNEIKEINDLINNHYKIPSFSNTEVKLIKDQEIVLEDTNNVLKNYIVSNSSNATFTINDNKLTIKAIKDGTETINITKVKVNNNINFYKSTSLQDLITRGEVTYNDTSFDLKIETGSIEIKKINKEKAKYLSELNGTIIHVLDTNFNFYKEVVITSEKEVVYLPIGRYYLKEISTTKGYNVYTKIKEVILTSNIKTMQVYFANETIKGDLLIEKYKGGADEKYVLEESAVFEVRDLNNNLVATLTTDNKGIAKTTLSYGKYNVIQINGSDGYSYIKPFVVNIEEEKVYKYELKNIKKSVIEIIKKDYSSKNVMKGVLYSLYDSNNNLIENKKTDEFGKIKFSNLNIGHYYLKEVETLKYYKLNTNLINVDITEDGLIVKHELTNEKNIGSLNFIKIDKDTKLPLSKARIMIYYDETDELIFDDYTNEEGKIVLNTLVAGKYYLIEKESPYGYLLNKDKIYFEILEDQEVIKIEMTNSKIVMPNTFKDTTDYYLISISIIIIIILYIKHKQHEN